MPGETRFIECSCGNWEQMPADTSRHKSQHFEWLENLDNDDLNHATYTCSCNRVVTSHFGELL